LISLEQVHGVQPALGPLVGQVFQVERYQHVGSANRRVGDVASIIGIGPWDDLGSEISSSQTLDLWLVDLQRSDAADGIKQPRPKWLAGASVHRESAATSLPGRGPS